MLLHAAATRTPIWLMCEALDWPMDRVQQALAGLDTQLRTVGLRLHSSGFGYSIERAVEPVEQDVIEKLLRRHMAVDGLRLGPARLLRTIIAGKLPKELGNADRVALGVLINAGLVEHADNGKRQDNWILAAEVRQSLLVEEPPTPAG